VPFLRLKRKGRMPKQIGAELEKRIAKATGDNAVLLGRNAYNRAHVVSGQTRGSIKVAPKSPSTYELTAGFGAPFEEARGGQHAFISQAIEATREEAKRNIEEAIEGAIG
jgi:hypothetical protein